jgi:hypothetical protein
MKEEFTKTVVQKHFYAICDICGARQEDTWRGMGSCEFCGKHLCRKCFIALAEDESGDYPDYKYACPEHRTKLVTAWEKYQEMARMDYPDFSDFIEEEKTI